MSHTTRIVNYSEVRDYRCDVCQGTSHVVPDEEVMASDGWARKVIDVCLDCLDGKAQAWVDDQVGVPTAEPLPLCAFCGDRHSVECAAGREEDERDRWERLLDKDLGRVV